MLGAIPNPKKSFDLDFVSQEVYEKIKYLPLLTKFKQFSKNDVLRTYRFEATEFLSFGVYADITISSISETKTKIEIEIVRKIGSFDKSYEVTEANQHIVTISEAISKCIILTPDQVEGLEKGIIEKEEKEKNKKWHEDGMIVFLLLVLFAPLGIILMWRNGNYSVFVRIIMTFVSLFMGIVWYGLSVALGG